MMTSSLSKSERTALWLDRLNRFSQSDQTVASFCASEGISVPSFYQWKRRLRPRVDVARPATKRSKPAAAAAHSSNTSAEANHRSSFAEVEISHASEIRVSLPGNVMLELGGRLDAVATVVREVLITARRLDSLAPISKE